MGNDVFGLIYTGESSMQLRDLTYSRSVAAVPFAGRYRCIDFIMSNLVNTGISNVGIIAQKNYHSLMDHLGSGKEWELHRKRDGLFILPPFVTRDNTGIYRARDHTIP
ncbi:MAG: sugar phosphate nucleotidyltransferase [Christensenellales bacterium]